VTLLETFMVRWTEQSFHADVFILMDIVGQVNFTTC
jgi:hypothetical protein